MIVKPNLMILVFLSLSLLASLNPVYVSTQDPPSPEQEKKAEQSNSQEFKSGFQDIPEFGGSDSVGVQLREADRMKKALARLPAVDKALKPCFDWKKQLNED